MKILYIGGVYATEYSLYRESQGNPNIDVQYVHGTSYSMPHLLEGTNSVLIKSRNDIDRIKKDFCPDLVLFRGWCPEQSLIGVGDVLWSQEIMATKLDGSRYSGGGVVSVYTDNPGRKHYIAYNIKDLAIQNNQYWLPRCVSKHWAKRSSVKDIPFMVATIMPVLHAGGDLKRKSLDILVKPIIEWDKSVVHAFSGYSGSFESIPYMKGTFKPSFPYINMTDYISRAKIYASPTTIWYDKGCISQKTIHSMACGVLTLTNRYMDIEDILGKDGENLIYSNSPEETLDKVKFYLSHDKEREDIAERGYHFIHNLYNWEKHLNRLFKEVSSEKA